MMPPLVSVSVPSPVKLTDVAEASGVPLDLLKEANPNLMRGVTPPGVESYRLWVPKDHLEAVEASDNALAARRLRGLKATELVADRSGRHTVAPGETLTSIAGRYGISVVELKSMNRLKRSRVKVGMRLVVPAKRASAATGKGKLSSHLGSSAVASAQRYRVRKGDSLDAIAKRFGLRTEDLKRLNRLKRNKIYVGQTLRVTDAKG
jgi:LysM repeat protein